MNILSHSIGCHFNCFFHCEEVFTFDIVSLDFFLLLFAFGVISKKNYCQGQCPGGSSLCFSLVVLWYQVFSYLSLEGKGGRKREDHWCVRETSIGWLALVCDRGLNAQPRHVPWGGIQTATSTCPVYQSSWSFVPHLVWVQLTLMLPHSPILPPLFSCSLPTPPLLFLLFPLRFFLLVMHLQPAEPQG